MNKNKMIRAMAVMLGTVTAFGSASLLVACTEENGSSNDKLIIMTEALNGLFNPFYSTAGTDMDMVGMTQLSMLSTNDEGSIAYGKDEATVVLDYKQEYNASEGTTGDGVTTYYFVIKNGLKFSDGEPLTMNDVLFNMYVYLDPVYTGSSTMYSTDILGLSEYRTQKASSSGSGSASDTISNEASTRAQDRINELLNLYKATNTKLNGSSSSYDVSEADMRDAINSYTSFSSGYKNAVTNTEMTTEELQKQLLADYELVLTTFKEELQNDYESYKDSYTEDPYKSTGEFDEITSFMYAEGFVSLEYEQEAGQAADKSKIKKVTRNYNTTTVKDKDSAVQYVYDSKVSSALIEILNYWGTANTIKTNFISKATEVILHEGMSGDELAYKNISGIVSMGHAEGTDSSITIGSNTYKIATSHNTDGTVANSDEYDVLRIKINGVDPKAIWNFGFSVAPYHYYSDPDKYKVDIENNEFGVEWGSYDFMTDVIQGTNKSGERKNQVPVGAGPYAASTSSYNLDLSSSTPTGSQFYSNNSVYFQANISSHRSSPRQTATVSKTS